VDQRKILESWKEIAAYLNRNVRTCQMWERDLGLPVHRLDGSPKARVFAYPDELDRWLDKKLHERDGRATDPKRRSGGSVLPILPRWDKALIAGLSAVSIAAVATSVWLIDRQAKVRWANDVAIPQIERLLRTPDRKGTFDLFIKVEKLVPRGPRLASLRPLIVSSISFTTEPRASEIWLKDYADGEDAWERLGRAPVARATVCQGYKRWKAEKNGRIAAEGAFHARAGYDIEIDVALDEPDTTPAGMVFIRGGRHMTQTPDLTHLPAVDLEDYFLDRYEVTNRQFKEFVDAGGYVKPKYWTHEFVKDGRIVPWAEGIKDLVDGTRRRGPATWRLGDYPDGQADHPVSGVSWYEAAAYAEFAGKTLPSFYHWEWASGNYHEDSGYIVKASNFGGQGPAPVGSFKGLGPFGTYDMAGNVKEWCANDIGGNRLLRGGAWNEYQYLFAHIDKFPPFMRADNFGFRCMKDVPGRGWPREAFAPLVLIPPPDFASRRPCSDEVFEVYGRLYEYSPSDLAARIESAEDWSERTRVEKVSIDDAYGEERVTVYLFLPRRGSPPYQTIVYFPGDSAWDLDSVFDYGTVKSREVELYTGGGRAFVFPVFKGTFERRTTSTLPETPKGAREEMIRWYRDIARCLDYLETRPEFAMDTLAYQGLSGGGYRGIVFAALDKRFKAAILMSGGLFPSLYDPARYAAECDLINFAPRVRIPVLMQNGRYDYMLPWEATIVPLFDLLGTPPQDKRLIPYESGHSVWFLNEYRRDIFDFLDEYFGPLKRAGRDRGDG